MSRIPSSSRRRRSFVDPDALTGTSGKRATFALLLVAAAADTAAFYQIVALLMSQQQGWMVWLLVAGFTGLSLGLTHIIGTATRRSVERHMPPAGLLALATTLGWLFMGAVCFFVRAVHTPTGENGGDSFTNPYGGSPAQDTAAGHDLGGALLFLGLYLAGGLVAGATSYLSHNPVAESYGRALRGHAESRAAVELLTPRQVRATHRYEQELAERDRDRRRWESATAERLAWADELKHYARHLMAAHLGDPAATDGLTDSGTRLMKPPPGRPGLHSAPLPEEAA
ncbi:hypothetical protein [Streptomyces europaeiscabiei]|uniref:hypothetical protein n=1 Tax=Streptomyces europaeiscabiei TaxID=146819 RepID=UPI002E2A71CD|nr:hypothetical protein [Streptomyces europaeiscabiei]